MSDDVMSGINKEEILNQISEIFMRYGIRSSSMDDIARYLKMSKKTLYGMFENKNDVVEQVIRYRKNVGDDYTKRLNINEIDPVSYIFNVLNESLEKFSSQMPANIYDVKKYHPDVYRKNFQETDNHGLEFLFRLLKKGIDDGVFRKELNMELNSYLISIQFLSLIDPEIECNPGFSMEETVMAMVENFIRAIATSKGVAQLENLIKNRQLNNKN